MAIDKDKFRQYISKPKIEKSTPKIVTTHIVKDADVIRETISVDSIIPSINKTEELDDSTHVAPTIDKESEFSLTKLNLSSKELLELKKVAYSGTIDETVTLSELIDLVLFAKTGKQIQNKNKDSLLLKEYIDIENKLTTKGKVLLEEDDTKSRLREIL